MRATAKTGSAMAAYSVAIAFGGMGVIAFIVAALFQNWMVCWLSIPSIWLGWKLWRSAGVALQAVDSTHAVVLQGLSEDGRFQHFRLVKAWKASTQWQRTCLLYGPGALLVFAFMVWAGEPLTRTILVYVAPELVTKMFGAL